MTALPREHAQWTLDVTIFHTPTYQHLIRAAVLNNRGGWHTVGTWDWQGFGVDNEMLNDICARIEAVIVEHVLTRYGLQDQLPLKWAGEPDPF